VWLEGQARLALSARGLPVISMARRTQGSWTFYKEGYKRESQQMAIMEAARPLICQQVAKPSLALRRGELGSSLHTVIAKILQSSFIHYLFIYFLVILWFELRASCLLGKHCTTCTPGLQPFLLWSFLR
jgi:hypothetical protein